MKVICVNNRDGHNQPLPTLIIGKIYDVEEGKETSPGLGVPNLVNGFVHAYSSLMDMRNWINTEEYSKLYHKEHKRISDIKNYYWVYTDMEPYGYNYDKKFFITLDEYRNQLINKIIE